MLILALDPGVTTGWATFQKPNRRDGYRSGQTKGPIWVLLESGLMVPQAEEKFVVIYETFTFRQIPKADLTPVEVIGVIKEWARQKEVPLVPQSPAEGKGFFSDDKLKVLQLYRPGHPHANDAMRHLLFYLSFGHGIQVGEGIIDKLRPRG